MLSSPLVPSPEVDAAHFMSSELRPIPEHMHSLTLCTRGLSWSQKGPERASSLTHQFGAAAPWKLSKDPKLALSLLTLHAQQALRPTWRN